MAEGGTVTGGGVEKLFEAELLAIILGVTRVAMREKAVSSVGSAGSAA